MNLQNFLRQKGQEYAPFDPSRAKRIFDAFKQDFLLSFKPKVIHIIGTNGKGSTGRYIALSLAKQYSILHFTSPHLFSFNERFCGNEGNLSWNELEKAHEILYQKVYMHESSYFEYATFLALFLARDLDFLILEAGLGGEFDSTNIVEEKISVFTQIGLDHMEILGQSLEQIARTKLNAMGKVAFLGIQNSSLIGSIAQEIAQFKKSTLFELKTYEHHPNIPDFLNQNFALAQRVLEYFGVVSCEIGELNLVGRAQRVRENIWLDVGHNVDSALALAKEFRGEKIILVFNAYKQKDIISVLGTLKNIISRLEILSFQHERLIAEDELREILKNLEIPFGQFLGFKQEEKYLVFGSFSVVEEILRGYL